MSTIQPVFTIEYTDNRANNWPPTVNIPFVFKFINNHYIGIPTSNGIKSTPAKISAGRFIFNYAVSNCNNS